MKLTMQLGNRSYDIIMKRGCLANLYQFINLSNRKVFILTDSGVPARYAQSVLAQCPDGMVYTVPQGEGSKSLKVFGQVQQAMLDFNMTRKDLLVSVGGGVIGDLGGFCAATYMRGIDFVNCPTTTLSQVDSSIGGKTAIDLGETKNIVGAFWQPKVVLVDFDTLETLPRRHYVNGLAEAVKMGLIADPELFALFEQGKPEDNIEQIIYRSLRVKKNVVEQDEREQGQRACLNFGHTIGHAAEKLGNYTDLTHGQAVAIGMVAAMRLSALLGNEDLTAPLIDLLKHIGLPTELNYDRESIFNALLSDKKKFGATVNFILVREAGRAEITPIDAEKLHEYVLKL